MNIFEMIFDITYLIIIWYFVFLFFKNSKVITNEFKITKIIFLLLAFGDTGHVGFRVLTYLNIGTNLSFNLKGFGSMMTAFTITIMYFFILELYFKFCKKDLKYYSLALLLISRFIIMLFPENQWLNYKIPYNWTLIRNIPLIIFGIILSTTFYFNKIEKYKKFFKNFGVLIFISYIFYAPVILFSHKFPLIGLLMIPKTIAYIVMIVYSYKFLVYERL